MRWCQAAVAAIDAHHSHLLAEPLEPEQEPMIFLGHVVSNETWRDRCENLKRQRELSGILPLVDDPSTVAGISQTTTYALDVLYLY